MALCFLLTMEMFHAVTLSAVLLACLFLGFAVTPAHAQQVQLTWDAPLQTNGTPIPNLAGYKLYYGSQSGQYPTMISVGMKTTYTVTNLSAGRTYYFAAKAYNSTGTEARSPTRCA